MKYWLSMVFKSRKYLALELTQGGIIGRGLHNIRKYKLWYEIMDE